MATQQWRSAYLKRRTTLLFCLVLLATAIALGVCYSLSRKNDGLCDANIRKHYLWTYAPTAWFTILAWIWSQVEYRSKQMQPWHSMASKDQVASESVLLDYISAWNVSVLWKAIKRRQVLVGAAISTSLLLQILIVLSTALFTASERTIVKVNSTITVKDHFVTDTSSFRPAEEVDGRAAALVRALLETNIEPPSGTTQTEAFQRFQGPHELGQGIQSSQAVVEVFTSEMTCEDAHLQLVKTFRLDLGPGLFLPSYMSVSEYVPSSTTSTLSVSTSVEQLATSTSSSAVLTPGLIPELAFQSVYSPSCGNVSFGTVPNAPLGLEIIYCPRGPPEDSRRLLFWTENDPTGHNWEDGFALICSLDYCIRNESVVLQNSTVHVKHETRHQCQRPKEFDIWQIFGALQKSTRLAEGVISMNSNFWPNIFESWLRDIYVRRPLSNSPNLSSALERAWPIFAAQTFSQYFRDPVSSSHDGSTVVVKNRLLLRELPFWLTESCLIAAIGVSLAVSIYGPAPALRRDPSSVIGLATILSRSKDFMQCLSGSGVATGAELNNSLSGTKFLADGNGAQDPVAIRTLAAIVQVSDLQHGRFDGPSKRTDATNLSVSTWYRSSSSRLAYIFGLPIILIALIVVIECLLHVSQSKDGISNVDNVGYEHFAWTSLPAVLMSGLALLIGMQLSDSQIFAPYSTLASGPRSASATIGRRPFSSIFTWRSVRNLESFLAASIVSVALSSLLTIVISGLFFAAPIPVNTSVLLEQQDALAGPRNPRLDGTLLTDLILTGDLSFPDFTYETLAISRPKAIPEADGNLDMMLPSVQANLNCTVVPSGDIVAKIYSANSTTFVPSEQQVFHADFQINGTCYLKDQYPNTTVWTLALGQSSDFTVYNNPWGVGLDPRVTYQFVVTAPENGYFGGLTTTGNIGNNRTSCPAVFGIFGQSKPGQIEALTLFTCFPYGQNIHASVNLKLPEQRIVTMPIVHYQTATPFNSSIHDEVLLNVLPIIPKRNPMLTIPPTTNVFDDFFTNLVYGVRGVSAEALADSSAQAQVLASINHQFGLAYAQDINANYRSQLNATIGPKLHGTLTTSSKYRLYQSAISTHILAGLLGAILITTTITTLTMKSRAVLPKNPCSIAAAASLLVDSDLLEMIPADSDKLSDAELLALFDGYVFSMGWWAGKEGEIGKKRFGIDFGTADNLR